MPFINRTMAKKESSEFISELVNEFGAATIAAVLDTIKRLGFKYATQAGITISKNDIVIPSNKEEILAGYEERVAEVEGQYERGLITESERHESIVNIWTEATDTVADAMEATLFELNPVFMMANSGARGSFKQIRQLAGMRGLMANPKGEIIERPIKANFMEGLSVLEYFISTHGARKGLADTALRTADSGYLTRRLVDVAQDVIVRELDCGTDEYIELPIFLPDGLNRSAAGRVLAQDVFKPLATGKPSKTKLAAKGEELTRREACGRSPRSSARTPPRRRSPSARCSSAVPRSASAAPATARSSPPARCARSATRSGSSPRSRSASRARS